MQRIVSEKLRAIRNGFDCRKLCAQRSLDCFAFRSFEVKQPRVYGQLAREDFVLFVSLFLRSDLSFTENWLKMELFDENILRHKRNLICALFTQVSANKDVSHAIAR